LRVAAPRRLDSAQGVDSGARGRALGFVEPRVGEEHRHGAGLPQQRARTVELPELAVRESERVPDGGRLRLRRERRFEVAGRLAPPPLGSGDASQAEGPRGAGAGVGARPLEQRPRLLRPPALQLDLRQPHHRGGIAGVQRERPLERGRRRVQAPQLLERDGLEIAPARFLRSELARPPQHLGRRRVELVDEVELPEPAVGPRQVRRRRIAATGERRHQPGRLAELPGDRRVHPLERDLGQGPTCRRRRPLGAARRRRESDDEQ
jgi:hypothetical protein